MFNGWCVSNGVHPFKLDWADYCDLAYFWLAQHADDESLQKFDEIVGTPPENETSEEAATYEAPGWSREEQMAAFMAF